jgi:hypothetical protein
LRPPDDQILVFDKAGSRDPANGVKMSGYMPAGIGGRYSAAQIPRRQGGSGHYFGRKLFLDWLFSNPILKLKLANTTTMFTKCISLPPRWEFSSQDGKISWCTPK